MARPKKITKKQNRQHTVVLSEKAEQCLRDMRELHEKAGNNWSSSRFVSQKLVDAYPKDKHEAELAVKKEQMMDLDRQREKVERRIEEKAEEIAEIKKKKEETKNVSGVKE